MASLAAVFTGENNEVAVRRLRDLTPKQFDEHKRHHARFFKLRQRLSLLYILELNFKSLNERIDECKSNRGQMVMRDWTQLNCVFMNYLSSAYAIRQHLETSIKRDFGRNSDPFVKFQRLLQQLEKSCFAYAFTQDFRNFVQHCGFPVGEIGLKQNQNTYALTLTYPRQELLKQYQEWQKSKLEQRPEQHLDLIALTRTHHDVVTKEISDAVIAMYGQDFAELEKYFTGLHDEAKAFRSDAHARLIVEFSGSPEAATIVLEDIPADPAAELGLKW
jgi:hypothetical protein